MTTKTEAAYALGAALARYQRTHGLTYREAAVLAAHLAAHEDYLYGAGPAPTLRQDVSGDLGTAVIAGSHEDYLANLPSLED